MAREPRIIGEGGTLAACRAMPADPKLRPGMFRHLRPEIDDTLTQCGGCGIDCWVGPRKWDVIKSGRAYALCWSCFDPLAALAPHKLTDVHPGRPMRSR